MWVIPAVNSLVPSSGSTQTTTWRNSRERMVTPQGLFSLSSITHFNRGAWLAQQTPPSTEGLVTFSRFGDSTTQVSPLPCNNQLLQHWKAGWGLGWFNTQAFCSRFWSCSFGEKWRRKMIFSQICDKIRNGKPGFEAKVWATSMHLSIYWTVHNHQKISSQRQSKQGVASVAKLNFIWSKKKTLPKVTRRTLTGQVGSRAET